MPLFRYDDDAPQDSDDDQNDKPKEDAGGEENKAAQPEPEEEEDEVQETRIDVEVPKISTNLGSDIHFVKLPNFLSIGKKPQRNFENEFSFKTKMFLILTFHHFFRLSSI